MAVGWIKFRKSLLTDGRVRMAARKCSEKKAAIIGGLAVLWMIADEQADDDGVLTGYISEDIDDEIGIPGFCQSLPEDWIDLTGDFVRLPNYLEHNGDTAKKRAQSATRKRKQRTYDEKCHAPSVTLSTEPVTPEVGQKCDQIRVDKSREDKTVNTPPTPQRGEDTELLELEEEFVSEWNKLEGVVENRGPRLTKERRRMFRTRIREPTFQWREAFGKFPLECFKNDPKGWKPSTEWILKPGNLLNVLEGKYDWSKDNNGAGNGHDRSLETQRKQAEQSPSYGQI